MRILTRGAVAAAAVLMLSSAAAGQSTTAAPETWAQFRGTPELSGASLTKLPDELELLWTLDAGESIDSSAAIAGGVVYIGTYSGELLAVDLETGAERWRYTASEEMGIGESSPAVGHGLVFVGDLAGVLHAVDAETGEAAWTYQTEGGDQVLAGHHGRRGADRLLRRPSLRSRRRDRRVPLEARDAQLRARHAGGRRRGGVLRGLRRDVPRRARGPTARRSSACRRAPTPRRRRRRTGTAPTSARSTTR